MGASQQKAQECPGFTIPELLISIFIIVLMTAIILPNWHTGETTLALDRAAHKLAQDFRKATELAQRAQFFQCANPGSISGYGMYIPSGPSTSYTLYVECNGNQVYDPGDAIFQDVTLEGKIQITSAIPSSFSMLFVPPVPTISIWPLNPSEAQVTLSVADDPSRFRVITITIKGVIDID